MKNLRDRIEEILPKVLPTSPEEAINGSLLAKKVLELLPDDKESSIRQTFSYLHTDSNSLLAKVPNKQGFYLRPTIKIEPSLDGLDKKEITKIEKKQEEENKRDEQREEKFRSFFIKYNELNGLFPMSVEHTRGKREERGLNKWKYPDVVTVSWEVGETIEDEYKLNTILLEVRKSLGEQPFRITSIELKVELSFSNYREHFFQCVSNSKWAHNATLAIAFDIKDSKLQTEIARLGKSYDVTITSYGLTPEQLDNLPNASDILSLSDEQFDELAKNIIVSPISTGPGKETLDWDQLNDLRSQNSDFETLLFWLHRCLKDGKAYSFDHFQKLREIERNY